MTDHNSFRLLLDACRRGDSTANAELVRLYLPLVRAAVRRRLGSVLRARFDSVDFAQDVWVSFFQTALHRQDLRDELALVAYLSQMARLKVAEEYRHQTTQKVGLNRVAPIGDSSDPPGNEPTPSAVVVAEDEWDHLTAGLSDRDRSLLRMLRDGHTHAEAAGAHGLSEKTVQRLLRRVVDRALRSSRRDDI
jgi:RNA polymerase sigma factor (sigma-70 family)